MLSGHNSYNHECSNHAWFPTGPEDIYHIWDLLMLTSLKSYVKCNSGLN